MSEQETAVAIQQGGATLPARSTATYEAAVASFTKALKAGMRIMDLPVQMSPGPIDRDTDEVNWRGSNMIEGEYTKRYLEGIILAVIYGRQAYPYAKGHGPESPPMCVSYDGEKGWGKPGTACAVCPLGEDFVRPEPSQPRCSSRTWVVLQEAGRLLPTVMFVPPTSTRSVRDYEIQLMALMGMAPWEAVTRFRLKPYTTANQHRVAQIRPRYTKDVSPLSFAQGEALNNAIMRSFRRTIELTYPEVKRPSRRKKGTN